MSEVVYGCSSIVVVVSITVLRVLWDMTRCVLSSGGVDKCLGAWNASDELYHLSPQFVL